MRCAIDMEVALEVFRPAVNAMEQGQAETVQGSRKGGERRGPPERKKGIQQILKIIGVLVGDGAFPMFKLVIRERLERASKEHCNGP